MKKILLGFLIVLSVFCLFSCTQEEETPLGFTFNKIDGKEEYEIVKVNATIMQDNKNVVIPSHYQGLPVTRIAPNSLTAYVSTIESITIPETITSIDVHFQFCDNLKSINVDKNNQHFKTVDGNLYSMDGKTLYKYFSKETYDTFTIPDTVVNIKTGAFENSNLKNITISKNVEVIGSGAFNYCYYLENVYFDAKCVRDLTSSAFTHAGIYANRTAITIGEIVTRIPTYLFAYGDFTDVVFPNGCDDCTHIGDYAFKGCNKLDSITIIESVKYIGEGAFRDCDGLKEVSFKNPAGWIETLSQSSITSYDLSKKNDAAWVLRYWGSSLYQK
ncbi:MAG: leucine-rich repeat domain-containing protein [Clostridia bacterium]|nr:leucine-rich repeat domain-containing protein [Clostridia bacterium]